MGWWVYGAGGSILLMMGLWWSWSLAKRREAKNYERGLKLVPILIHLPPSTDDKEVGQRDERDLTSEVLSDAQVMYSIIAATATKGWQAKLYKQRHITFEIVAVGGVIKYYAMVPMELVETLKQAVMSAYPTAKLEETGEENIFAEAGGFNGVSGGELILKKEGIYPIATYEMTKRDAMLPILNALNSVGRGDGAVIQILLRPASGDYKELAKQKVKQIRGEKGGGLSFGGLSGVFEMLWKPLEKQEDKAPKQLTNLQQEEVEVLENKIKHPGFEAGVRIVASSSSRERSEAILGGVVAAFAQFDSPMYNGFKYQPAREARKLTVDYAFRLFPQKINFLNSVELVSIFHLPSQNVIPTSKVERQLIKQVDGPVRIADDGLLLGVNEYRGVQKQIKLSEDDRRRHIYVIGATGMGKSVFLGNMAYQDMMDGRGFAFIDPHGDVVEDLLSKVPPERIDDVIYFDPSDMENPVGMNMFEFETPDQKDFIVQEGINMLYSLYDPGHTGIFGPRGEHMFRNAALLLMSDPNGATFIDVPKVFVDPEFVKEKLKYVTDRSVYDYWTKEFPASQRSNDAGEVTTWFVSKWSPFLSNMMMRNILGQTKSGFNIREAMDSGKILLVNLSKGKMGELNSKLLGMILVMKFQTAAMARADMAESERRDFGLFVDEFQNFSTESFESILSEARKFRLSLVVANQFMTQLTDKIREGILGNVGTIIAGRVGVTDAQMLEKAFLPVFNAEDLHKLPNHHAVATVMMFGMPSSPFTMRLLPPMGEKNLGVLMGLKNYSATKYGRARRAVEVEIDERMSVRAGNAEKAHAGAAGGSQVHFSEEEEGEFDGGSEMRANSAENDNGEEGESFVDKWLKKRQAEQQHAEMVTELERRRRGEIEEGEVVKIR